MYEQWAANRDTIEQARRILLRLHRRQRVYIILADSGWRIL